MNKKRLKILILLLFASCAIALSNMSISHADSGWDTGYDGGSGGSSYSSGGGGGSSGSSSYSYSYSYGTNTWSSSSSSSSGPSKPMTLVEKMVYCFGFHYVFVYIASICFFLESRDKKINGFFYILLLIGIPILCFVDYKIVNSLYFNSGEGFLLALTFIVHTIAITISTVMIKEAEEDFPVELILIGFTAIFAMAVKWYLIFSNLIGLALGYVIYGLIKNMPRPKKLKPWNYFDLPDDIIQQYLPDETVASLKKKLYKSFVDVQMAWMNFDYDALKELCTDELATSYIEQLKSLNMKKGQNIMNGFKPLKSNIVGIREKDGIITIDYALRVKFRDYVINVVSKKVDRGQKHFRICNDYSLVYVVYGHLIDGKLKCPHCGAMIVPNKEGICEYCRTKVSFTNDKIILSKKGLL